MTFPTTGNLAPALADLAELERAQEEMRTSAREILDQIRTGLVGQRVRAHGREWQICQVDVRTRAVVTCYGVTVSRSGKVGTRGFCLGDLSGCQFLDETGAVLP